MISDQVLTRHLSGLTTFLPRGITGGPVSPKWNVLKVLHRHVVDESVRVLHRDHVVVAGLGIDPVARRYLAVRGHGSDDIVDDVLCRKADQAGPLTIDVECNTGILKVLRDIEIAHVGHSLYLCGH